MKIHKGHAPLAIGSVVIVGTANSVLFIDANGKLAELNPGFTFDTTAFKINRDTQLTAGKKLVFDAP